MKKLISISILVLLISSCVSISSPLDREYKRYLDYKKELNESVAQGQMNKADALKLDQEAYQAYQVMVENYTTTPVEKEYKRYLAYKKELQESAAQGKISPAEAARLDQQAYESYRVIADQHMMHDTVNRAVAGTLGTVQQYQEEKTRQQFFSR